MDGFPHWLAALKGASLEKAIEVIGREFKPAEVIALGRPSWDTLDAVVGLPSVERVLVFSNYRDPSKVITGWNSSDDKDDVFVRPITRPSRAVTLNRKIRWVRPDGEGWRHTCDLVVLSREDFPFHQGFADSIGEFVHCMAPDTFVSSGEWKEDFPPPDFVTQELFGGHCGFHPVHVSDKIRFNMTARKDPSGARARMGRHTDEKTG